MKMSHYSTDSALRSLGLEDKHATHGFRAMLRTLGRERLGIDTDILEAQLAHAKRGEVQAAYDRTTFTEARRDAPCSAGPTGSTTLPRGPRWCHFGKWRRTDSVFWPVGIDPVRQSPNIGKTARRDLPFIGAPHFNEL